MHKHPFYYFLVLCLALSGCAVWANSRDDVIKAVKFNDVKAVQRLLRQGVDPNTVDDQGNPLLYLAMREKSRDVATILIDDPKTDLEQENHAKENAMMIAALQGLTPLVKLMIDKDAEVNKHGWTPLHYAAANGHDDIVKLLLDHAAYIDAESPNGTTPLMMAARGGHITTVKLLLDEGADLRLKNQLGMTAIDFANRSHQKEIADGLTSRLQNMEDTTKPATPQR